MRVIRTELYFESDQVNWTPWIVPPELQHKNPGVSISWIPFEGSEALSADDLLALLSDDYPKAAFKNLDDILPIFVDLAIQGVRGRES